MVISSERYLSELAPHLLLGAFFVPILIAAIMAWWARRNGDFDVALRRSVGVAFAAVFGLYGSIVGTRGETSTSVIVFLFLPFYVALVAFLVTQFARIPIWLIEKRNSKLGSASPYLQESRITRRLWKVAVSTTVIAVAASIGLLASFSHASALYRAAGSSETSKEDLVCLFEYGIANGSSGGSVHMFLAGNPNVSPEILAELATSSRTSVRVYTAGNPSTPEGVLKVLLDDPAEYVANAARKNLESMNGSSVGAADSLVP